MIVFQTVNSYTNIIKSKILDDSRPFGNTGKKWIRAVNKIADVLIKSVLYIALAISTLIFGTYDLFAFPFRVLAKKYVKKTSTGVDKIAPKESMISYNFSGGRFGDCLITYLHAKWLSYKYQLPLAYIPFQFSDQLALHQIERQYDTAKFKKSFSLGTETPFKKLSQQTPKERIKNKELYSINYFPESPSERGPNYTGAYIEVNWNDPEFKKIIADSIKPIGSLHLITPPKDRVSIAIHWSRGSGEDTAETQNYYPCKVPPEEFYVSQLLKVCRHYANKPLYIYLFTDDKNPLALQEKLLTKIKSEGITQDILFGKREEKSIHPVLEDFFSMAQFQCLIRSESHFSIVAQLIGNHELVIGPSRFHSEVESNKADLVIDQIAIFENGKERRENVEIRFPFIQVGNPLNTYLRHYKKSFGLNG